MSSYVLQVIGSALAPVLLSACASGLPSQVATPSSEKACPRLDSQLRQLTTSDKPAEFARTHGLDLNAAGVRVIVELTAGASIPAGYSVTVEGRYASQVQGRVPLDQLCALAGEPVVLRVALPAPLVPLGGGA
jgi:hypothetical protein